MYGSRNPPLAVSHRGLHHDAPENSLEAFRRAVLAGADGLELDVHATRDGHVVVHHDFNVRRRRGRTTYQISELDLNELAGFPLSDSSSIPLLSDVLGTIPPEVELYVEVKPASIERLVVDCILSSHFPVRRCAIHSFDHRIARNARRISEGIAVGILQVGYPIDAIGMMRDADARDFWQQWEFIDDDIVKRIHAHDGRIVAWTCNDPSGWERLAALGVDAICTDTIEELIAWRTALGTTGPHESLTT